MSRSNKKMPFGTVETQETRKMRVAVSFGKFGAKSWDGKKSNKQKRQAWKDRGICE